MAGKPKRVEMTDRDWLSNQYLVERKSSVMIASDLGVTSPTVLRWLSIHNIPTRSISEAQKGRTYSIETLQKMSKSQKKYLEENGHFLIGKKLSEEWCESMRKARTGVPIHTEEQKRKYSEEQIGEKNPNWRDGASFEPYCVKFNFELKEKIRNRDNRVCQMPECGKSEIANGRRLAVHHIDGDKMQGCNGNRWYLTALCIACNLEEDTLEKEFLIVSNSRTLGSMEE